MLMLDHIHVISLQRVIQELIIFVSSIYIIQRLTNNEGKKKKEQRKYIYVLSALVILHWFLRLIFLYRRFPLVSQISLMAFNHVKLEEHYIIRNG